LGNDMTIKNAFIMIALIVASFASAQSFKFAKDDHKFLVKEIENLTPIVEFILLETDEEHDAARKEFIGHGWNKVSAFTRWNETEGTCKIYIKDPLWKYEPELIGHEVAHCIWGRFHKGRKGLRKN
jgi:hypothetical protein